MISVLLIVRREEEDGGENSSDLDEVGVGWFAVFNLELFSSCFEERGDMEFNLACRHGLGV